MPATNNITIDMLLTEQKRIRRHMESFYPAMVQQQKLSPWERDHRLSLNKKLIDLLTAAKQNKDTNGPKLSDLLNQLP
jgi:hypothetical protein